MPQSENGVKISWQTLVAFGILLFGIAASWTRLELTKASTSELQAVSDSLKTHCMDQRLWQQELQFKMQRIDTNLYYIRRAVERRSK